MTIPYYIYGNNGSLDPSTCQPGHRDTAWTPQQRGQMKDLFPWPAKLNFWSTFNSSSKNHRSTFLPFSCIFCPRIFSDEDLVLKIRREFRQGAQGRDEPAVAHAALTGVRRLHVSEEHRRRVQRQGTQPAGLSEECDPLPAVNGGSWGVHPSSDFSENSREFITRNQWTHGKTWQALYFDAVCIFKF